jgi:hypothetical protein
MLDCPARMNTLSGLAKENGERTHRSAAVRIGAGLIVIPISGDQQIAVALAHMSAAR